MKRRRKVRPCAFGLDGVAARRRGGLGGSVGGSLCDYLGHRSVSPFIFSRGSGGPLIGVLLYLLRPVVPSLPGLCLLSLCPGTAVPGSHIPSLRDWRIKDPLLHNPFKPKYKNQNHNGRGKPRLYTFTTLLMLLRLPRRCSASTSVGLPARFGAGLHLLLWCSARSSGLLLGAHAGSAGEEHASQGHT